MSRIGKYGETATMKDEPFYADIAQQRMTARQFATHYVANLSEKLQSRQIRRD
ncbi:MAG: hypothetical protein LBV29_01420 [Azoarcus sp.]|jgi:hypothetical protein|nr:hypothetical protein [Azoarcus sp.]